MNIVNKENINIFEYESSYIWDIRPKLMIPYHTLFSLRFLSANVSQGLLCYNSTLTNCLIRAGHLYLPLQGLIEEAQRGHVPQKEIFSLYLPPWDAAGPVPGRPRIRSQSTEISKGKGIEICSIGFLGDNPAIDVHAWVFISHLRR